MEQDHASAIQATSSILQDSKDRLKCIQRAGTGASVSGDANTYFSELINDSIVSTSSIFLVGSFFWVPVCLWRIWKTRCKTRRRKVIFLACVILLLTVPFPVNRKLARLALWDRFLRYFSADVVGDVGASPKRQSIFCLSPHGVFPVGIALGSIGRLNDTVFNSLRPVVASVMVHTPIVGHLLRAIGAVKATPAAIDKALEQGHSLGLAPGGIGEIFLDGKHDKEPVLLRSHRGFVRRAMAHGVPLIPVYVFGLSDAFKRVPLPSFLETISRYLQISIILFFGRFGLPIPFKVPLRFAFGEPLEVERNPSPTAEEVDAVHSRFCRALTDVFERHKDDYGWGNKSLELR